MRSILFAIMLTGLLLSSCRKSDRDLDESILASQDEISGQMYLSNTFTLIDEAARHAYGIIPSFTNGHLDCATVIPNLIGTPNTISIDFGGSCIGSDERVRKGQIYCTIAGGNYGDSGVVITANFVNYFVDDIELDGSISYTYMGENANMQPYFNYSYMNLNLRSSNPSREATLSGTGSRILINDNGTPASHDDIYELSGSFTGRSQSGNTFSSEITSNLVIDHSCKYITSGNMAVIPDNLVPRFLDFGDGACDSLVVITISETQHQAFIP